MRSAGRQDRHVPVWLVRAAREHSEWNRLLMETQVVMAGGLEAGSPLGTLPGVEKLCRDNQCCPGTGPGLGPHKTAPQGDRRL